MDISQSAPNTAANSQQNPGNASNRASLTSDYEMFLQMLTTQMTNQDPLNPVDSSDYAVQLATFSSVEQQVLTNELLMELTAKMSASGLSDLAGYVGREVRTTAPAYFGGAPIDLIPNIANGADAAKLTIRNDAGSIVQEFELDTAGNGVSWAGMDDQGRSLPLGVYSFEVISFENGEELSRSPASTYARIIEAQNAATGLELILVGGVTVSPDDVTAMRE